MIGCVTPIQSKEGNSGIIFDGHKYELVTISKTWNEAKMDCVARGGHLVTITSSKENNFVNDLAGSNNIWIGFTDNITEGDWQWITGESVTFTNWASDEPNNVGAGENFAEMFSDGTWNDAGPPGSPKEAYYYVCEWENEDLQKGLVFHLPMNEGSGTIVFDQSDNGNDGTIYGAKWTTGIAGTALEFDGQDDYIKVNPPPDLSSGLLTISVWTFFYVAPDPTEEWLYGIICQDDYTTRIIQLITYGGMFTMHRFEPGPDLFSYDTNIEAYKWYHVAVTFNGSYYCLYADGVLNDEQPGSFTPNDLLSLIIGDHNTGGFPFDGIIDEVRIYNRSLSIIEVKQLAGISFYDDDDNGEDTTDEKDTSDSHQLISPGFELVSWPMSLFILVLITKIVKKFKYSRE